MNRRELSLWSPAIGAPRHRARLRPLRPAAARLPIAGGAVLAVRGARDDRRDRRSDRRRPCEGLRRRQLRLRELAPRRPVARGTGTAARPLRGLDPQPGGAVHPRGRRRRPGDHGHRRLLRRLPRRQLRAQARRPLPARDLPQRRLRRLGRRRRRAGRRDVLQQPGRLRLAPRRRPPRLAPRPGQPPARLRAGPVGGHDGRAREHEALRRPARREGHPPRARPLGPRRGARLARVARADRSSSAPVRSDGAHTPDRSAARHRGGLAGRVRAPARQGRPDRVPRRDARARLRADLERALRPALPAALPARDRPARLVVHGAARVAEEGLADGRRLPDEQPVHVPGDGEALRVLRDDAARAAGARDLADPAQEPAGERALRARRPSATTSRSTSSRSPRRSATRST